MNDESAPTDATAADRSNELATSSIDLLKRRLGMSPAPRSLTPFEIELLRRSKEEVSRAARKLLGARWSRGCHAEPDPAQRAGGIRILHALGSDLMKHAGRLKRP